MERERRLGSWLRGQDARREHGLRPRKTLLVGLKDEPDGAAQLRLMLPQQLRRAKEHGRVQIVAAGVHGAVFRAEGEVGALRDAQGVHVGAQEHAAARVPARDVGGQAARERPRVIAHFAQAAGDILARLRQIGADLGVGVQLPPVGQQLRLQRAGLGEQTFGHDRHGKDLLVAQDVALIVQDSIPFFPGNVKAILTRGRAARA